MAITQYQNGVSMNANGDTLSRGVLVRSIYIKNGASAGLFTFGDADGNQYVPSFDLATDANEYYSYPFGTKSLNGLQLLNIPSGSVEIIYQ